MKTTRWPACCLVVLLLATPALAQQGLHWETNFETARAQAAQTNRLVLVHFTAKWCGPCKVLEQQVFSQPGFGQALASQYVAVKLDVDANQALVTQWGVEKFPTDVILNSQGQVLTKIVSPQSAEQYVGAMQQIAAAARQRGLIGPPAGAAAPPPQVAATPSAPNTAPAGQPLSDQRYADYYNNRPGPGAATASQPVVSQPLASPAPIGPAATPPNPGPAPGSPYNHLVNTPAAPAAAPLTPQPAVTPPALTERRDPVPYANPDPRQAAVNPPVAPPTAPLQSAAPPVSPPLVNSQPSSPATAVAPPNGNPPIGLDGFCPVTLVQSKQWIKGDTRWGAIHRGRTYLFASPEAQQQFLATPDNFSPMMSGDDPVLALDHSQAIPGRRQHGVFYGGRIVLFSSEASLKVFSDNPSRYSAEVQQARR